MNSGGLIEAHNQGSYDTTWFITMFPPVNSGGLIEALGLLFDVSRHSVRSGFRR